MSDLNDLIAAIDLLPPEQREELELVASSTPKWVPNAGPQAMAYEHPADILYYGGGAGGGKTSMILGLAFTAHRRSLILRRQYTDMMALTEEAIEINGTRDGFNGSPPPKLVTTDGRLIHFGAAAKIGDERTWQGNPHDLLAFDEAVHFAEKQVRFLWTWVRSTVPGQRTRIVLGSNPPTEPAGQWIVGMFRPWLDLTHPNPAKPGELRWFVSDPDGKDFEVPDNKPYQFPGQPKPVMPLSRTFIPAKAADNPYYAGSNYEAMLDSLDEPERSAFRDGNFFIAHKDHERQLFPTAWVMDAVRRWKATGGRPPDGVPMTAIGLDVAAGGMDNTVMAPRHDWWFAPLIVVPGKKTPLGSDAAAEVVRIMRGSPRIIIDMGGGYGGGAYEWLRNAGHEVVKFNGAESTKIRTGNGKMPLYNKRAAAAWRLREALNPDQEGGSPICLPDDQILIADLTAMLYKTDSPRGYQVQSKDEIRDKIGRSPDRGDAVIYSWWTNGAAATFAQAGMDGPRPRGWTPRVIMGHQGVRRLAGR